MSQLLTSNNQQSSYAATWNDAATVFTAWKLNVTDTASNSGSLLLDLQVGGSSKLSVTKQGFVNFSSGSISLRQYSGVPAFHEAGTGHIFFAFASWSYVTLSAYCDFTWANGVTALGTVDLRLARDAAGILAQRNGTNTQAFRLYRTYTDSSNYEALELAHATYSSAQYSILRTITAGTGADNINLVLSPSGTGAILAQVPDGTATGGNARGQNAVDLVMTRFSAGQVATGIQSALVGGRGNTSSATYSGVFAGEEHTASGVNSVVVGGNISTASGLGAVCVGGNRNAASGSYTVAHGQRALADKFCQASHGSGQFATTGDAQRSVLVMRCLTTDDSKTQLYLDGASLQATIPNNTAWHADIRIVGRENAGANHAVFHRKVGIYKNTTAASATLLGTVQTIGTDYKSDATWAVTITADTGTGALKVEAQGNLDQDVRWVAEVSLVEVAFA